MQWIGSLLAGITLAITSLFGGGPSTQVLPAPSIPVTTTTIHAVNSKSVKSPSTLPIITPSSTVQTSSSTEAIIPPVSTADYTWVPYASIPTEQLKNSQYLVQNNKLYFLNTDNGPVSDSNISNYLLDVATNGDSQISYARLANTIYYAGEPLPITDLSSFQVVEDVPGNNTGACPSIAKDSQHVYYQDTSNGNDDVYKEANPTNFSIIRFSDGTCSDFETDGMNVFYGDQKVSSADAKTFTVLDSPYAKDKNNVYFGGYAITEADPTTFALLYGPKGESTAFSKDKNHVYFSDGQDDETQIVQGADPATFIVLLYNFDNCDESCGPNDYEKDKNYVYSTDADTTDIGVGIIPDADPATFEVTGTSTAKDKNHTYLNGKVVN